MKHPNPLAGVVASQRNNHADEAAMFAVQVIELKERVAELEAKLKALKSKPAAKRKGKANG